MAFPERMRLKQIRDLLGKTKFSESTPFARENMVKYTQKLHPY